MYTDDQPYRPILTRTQLKQIVASWSFPSWSMFRTMVALLANNIHFYFSWRPRVKCLDRSFFSVMFSSAYIIVASLYLIVTLLDQAFEFTRLWRKSFQVQKRLYKRGIGLIDVLDCSRSVLRVDCQELRHLFGYVAVAITNMRPSSFRWKMICQKNSR